jgi:hypothetical protein
MKHKLHFIAILALLMTLFVSSCNSSKSLTTLESSQIATPEVLISASPSPEINNMPEPEPTPDYFEVYREKLDYFHNILSNGIENWDYGKGEVGLMEVANFNPENVALASVGYTIKDISGDGIPELLITNIYDPGSYPAKGSSILALFTISDGTPTLTFEGWSRNLYLFHDKGKIFNSGSNGADHHVYIINELSLDGKHLECINYYISQPKENDPETVGYFKDPECGIGQHVYDELDLDFDSFKQLIQDQLGNVKEFELTLFSNYTPSSQEASESTHPVVKIQWAEEALANFASYDTFTADESEHQVELLLSSTQPLNNFNFLRVSIDGVDEDGELITTTESIYTIDTLMPDHPLVVTMSFYGDLPSYGISYEDENGETRNFYITLSGKDGSLLLVEFNTP